MMMMINDNDMPLHLYTHVDFFAPSNPRYEHIFTSNVIRSRTQSRQMFDAAHVGTNAVRLAQASVSFRMILDRPRLMLMWKRRLGCNANKGNSLSS